MASVADAIFALPEAELSTGIAWVGTIAYALQIFYDFSGYSCMAIGLGRMIGFTFPENFNYPYISSSVREFWRRWHITLSTWFRDYLYIPLGGSKKGELLTYRNLLIVFFVCGFWHGASWNFIVWGLFHGFFLIIERLAMAKTFKRLPKSIHHIYLLFIVSFSWVIFRTETLPEAFHFFLVMLGFNSAPFHWYTCQELLQTNTILVLIVGIIFSMPVFPFFQKILKVLSFRRNNIINLVYLGVLVLLFMFSAMSLASGTYNPFIYFRF